MGNLKRGIIISIQGYQRGTTNELASEAVRAGAIALRTDKPIKLQEGIERVPVIGLHKLHVRSPSKEPYITATVEALEQVAAWADYVAIDCRELNAERAALLQWCSERKVKVVADVETMKDVYTLMESGGAAVDYIATTFSVFHKNHRPDLELVVALAANGIKNVIAEGNYSSRVDVRQALQSGAHAVCIGSAVSNVYKLTRKYTTLEF